MKLNKKDLIWSIALVVLPAVALVAGMIPGIAVLTSQDDPNALIYSNLLMIEGWNNMGISASLQIMLTVYLLIASVVYLRGQSVKVLQSLLIFACVATAAGVITMLTEQSLKALPFGVLPGLCALEVIVSFIRLKLEQRKMDF